MVIVTVCYYRFFVLRPRAHGSVQDNDNERHKHKKFGHLCQSKNPLIFPQFGA